MRKRYKDKVVMVLSACSNVGKSIAMRVAGEGARVILVGDNQEKLMHIADLLHHDDHSWIHEDSHMTITCDTSDSEQVQKMFEAIEERFPGIDTLVNCSITNLNEKNIEKSASELNRASRLLFSDTNYVSIFARQFLAVKNGNLVNVLTSVVDNKTRDISFNLPVLQIAESGLDIMTRELSELLREDNIRVNAVSGCISAAAGDEAVIMNEDAVLDQGTKDISSVVAYLGSYESRMIAGSTLPVVGRVKTQKFFKK